MPTRPLTFGSFKGLMPSKHHKFLNEGLHGAVLSAPKLSSLSEPLSSW